MTRAPSRISHSIPCLVLYSMYEYRVHFAFCTRVHSVKMQNMFCLLLTAPESVTKKKSVEGFFVGFFCSAQYDLSSYGSLQYVPGERNKISQNNELQVKRTGKATMCAGQPVLGTL